MEVTTSEFPPRAYQIDLYEKAVEDNIIVYLPTGAGKTYIAVMLLKKLSGELQMPYSKNGKRSIFIVNTVALVRQQAEYIKRHTCLTCKGYSGDMKVDVWKEDRWKLEFDEIQVLVMTAQILVDIITRGYMKLDRINLIIFDECHRAVYNHPMRQIMQLFENYPKEQQPRTLAMSATLLNSNIKSDKIQSTIKDLEVTFQAKIATVQSVECIQEYCTNPKENIIKYDTYVASALAVDVNDIIEESVNVLKNIILDTDKIFLESSPYFQPKKKSSKLISIMKDIITTTTQTGIYGGNKSVLLHLIQLEYLKKYCDNTQTNVILEYLITQVIRIRKLFDETMKDYTELERIYKFSSDQVNKLFILLKNFNENKLGDQKFCCIIFVKERFMTKVMYSILKTLSEHDEQYSFLLPDYIIGCQNNPYKNTREVLCLAKWQKEVMQRFRKGLCNCVVATDVVDEGIDVPLCALVVRYDLPTDYRAYVQSKGRARHGTSHYTVLVPRNDDSFLSRYRDYKNTELIMKEILVGNEVRSLPTDQEIENGLYQYEIVPYCLNDTGNVLTENTVVNILNRYCSSLLNCKFVTLVPIWTLYKNVNDLFQVSIQLPSISPVKDVIYGDPMTNISGAKRSAAMKCCIRLHKLGALKDNLELAVPNAVLEGKDHLFPNWQHEDDSWCGTHNKKRRHKLEHPTALYEAFPCSGKKLYLHILHTSPTYSVPHDNRHLVFYNLLNDKSGFGILSIKNMPKIPSFPIFMNVGELNVTVKPNYATMTLNEEDIKSLKIYHTLLFSEVIPVIKNFTVFDKDNLENSFLIVPLNVHWEVNWDIVRKYQQVEKVSSSTLSHVRYSDYEVALVNPSYRASPSVYIVTQVCDDLTPKSLFPTDDFETYIDYYEEKHGLKIQNLEQPLLEVKAISTKINCIKPRSMKPGLSKRRRADVLEDFEEHLIPELCRKICFPALYWLKASTLPSILHRVTQLLIAEDLRTTIVSETGLGIITLPSGSEWPALDMIEKEIEPAEPLLDTTLDDTVESTQTEPDINEVELDVMNTESNLYPWPKDQEPQDIYRNIENIQMIDVQYYCNFMLTCDEDDTVPNNLNKNINYISKPIVAVPPLYILAKKQLHGPSPAEIMQALTTKICHDGFNLERLETLGDSYLKFITSLFLYHSFPELSEGQLTAIKGKIIGNRNLYYSGIKKSIPGRMKIDEFMPMSTFIVPAYTVFRPLQKTLLDQNVSLNILYELTIPDEERLTGNVSASTSNAIQNIISQWSLAESQTGMEHYLNIQIVPDKAVSDCVEALIGIYLRSTGISGAAKLLQWFGILPDIAIDELLNGTSLSHNSTIGGNPNEHMPWADSLERRLGYKFNNRAYLLEAFTHPSYSVNRITGCYQRLEFLGDAILDLLITCHIYESCGNLNPGALTDLRSALVNNITFACLAVRYGLHTCLLAYAPQLHEIINRFVKFQEERDYTINDELLWVLLEEEDCNLAEYIDVPKVLGDLFETLIGAIYLDSNRNLTKVWEMVYSFMHKEIDEFSRNIPKNPVRVIHEHQNAHAKFLEATSIGSRNIIMVPLKVNIAGKEKIFHGFGSNKKLAKCAAAKQALKRLRSPK
ncbi:PREDICTED: endoribonuclease Dicer [Dinoponera quadriceps]|uniref:ribonuclease III n=1 Tax=Dinoponera quadriceps TaxID=609295 RepID=A0A6P3X653_DINQU|nr:PREDICTED: endoribonuclease Dicer [Dinoponera quadriceps]